MKADKTLTHSEGISGTRVPLPLLPHWPSEQMPPEASMANNARSMLVMFLLYNGLDTTTFSSWSGPLFICVPQY